MAKANEEKISVKEFSRRIGVSDTAVHNEIYNPRNNAKGCMKACISINKGNGRKMISWEVGLAEWRAANRAIKNPEYLPKAEPTPPPPVQDLSLSEDDEGDGKSPPPASLGIDIHSSKYEAERLKEVYAAGVKKIQYLKAMNTLVEVDRVRIVLYEFGKAIKNQLQQIAPSVASLMRAAESDRAAQDILQNKVESVLEFISTGPAQQMTNDDDPILSSDEGI